jgi:glutamate synthase (NADPH/NADH) small chain
MPTTFHDRLPDDRTEASLPDAKPLLTEAEARLEAERCLYCADAPCTLACPTSIDVPGFIKRIATGNVRGSARTIFEQNVLGYSCARVCPVEVLCEGACVYEAWQKKPIAIGRLQRFAMERTVRDPADPLFTAKPATGKRAACVGAGPASLAFAAHLAMEGHHATVFEKRRVPGGLDTTGVAPYKLHADEALREIEWLGGLGFEIRTDVEIGRDLGAPQLLAEYDAVFLGLGLGEDTRLGVPGEDGPGVVGATAWIEQMKLGADPNDHAGTARSKRADPNDNAGPARSKRADPNDDAGARLGRVVVVGGGNTAIDVARECAQLGAEDVVMVYRRGTSEMSGYDHEMTAARIEGVRTVLYAQPVAVVRDEAGTLRALRIARTEGGTPVPGTERDLACDLVATAIGQSKLQALARQFPGVELDARGCIVADATTGATGHPKVFAGGDCVNGGREVVDAVAAGRDAARHLIARWRIG